jgi:hypothetical protein
MSEPRELATLADGAQIQFALISHTNNGKTTLARTLLGGDIGEVRDAPHVTSLPESHLLLEAPEGDQLRLWDTPGFGDSLRLQRRLAMSGNPIGWFLREVIDRYRDRPLWLSQQAMRTAREHADIVLYLVNSAESPQDAGYLAPEMQILEWLGKPVMVLLNQLGPPGPQSGEQEELGRWTRYLDQYPVVRCVLPLDAFARCWVHERVFYEAAGPLLPAHKQPGYTRLLKVWETRNQHRFAASMDVLARQLASAARDHEEAEVPQGGLLKNAMQAVGLGRGRARADEQAMARLLERLNQAVQQATADLLALHHLDRGQATRINARVADHFVIRAPVDKAQAGLWGAVVSGAATGLSADLMAGGLSFGAGALIGGIVGALTLAGAAWGFNVTTERNQPVMRFADEFLAALLAGAVLRYLAVAHFGRGRGEFVESEAPSFWQAEVEQALASHRPQLPALWQQLREAPDEVKAIEAVLPVLHTVLTATLTRLYPATLR